MNEDTRHPYVQREINQLVYLPKYRLLGVIFAKIKTSQIVR